MENIPILEGISPDEVAQMWVCFGVREESFRADTVIYDISEGRGELGLLTAGSAVIQRIDRQGGRTILHLPFTLSALADYISADRSAMMRELRKMKEEHLVDIDRGQVTLHHALA